MFRFQRKDYLPDTNNDGNDTVTQFVTPNIIEIPDRSYSTNEIELMGIRSDMQL